MEVTVIYRCPNTGRRAEAMIESRTSDTRQYQPHFCPACRQIHLINQVSGRLIGDKPIPQIVGVR